MRHLAGRLGYLRALRSRFFVAKRIAAIAAYLRPVVAGLAGSGVDVFVAAIGVLTILSACRGLGPVVAGLARDTSSFIGHLADAVTATRLHAIDACICIDLVAVVALLALRRVDLHVATASRRAVGVAMCRFPTLIAIFAGGGVPQVVAALHLGAVRVTVRSVFAALIAGLTLMDHPIAAFFDPAELATTVPALRVPVVASLTRRCVPCSVPALHRGAISITRCGFFALVAVFPTIDVSVSALALSSRTRAVRAPTRPGGISAACTRSHLSAAAVRAAAASS